MLSILSLQISDPGHGHGDFHAVADRRSADQSVLPAQFYVFSTAVEAGYIGLAVIGVLNSAVSAYYYIRVIVTMYMRV